ncbi:hypothetical protein K6624_22540 [Escherichia coli]|uniref:hypothetical protein n=1 Tax=Escherichia coli TaxID=562 RepID=UPI001CBF3F39|nr:hypothetical protein [Escherichia coli]MBZ2223593.1 hypothetical protein [Escherichia coli]
MVFNSLIRQTMGNAGRVSPAFNPLNRQSMAGSWSGTVAFNPLIAVPWGGWSRSVAFNPLIAGYGEAGLVAWHLTP